MSHHTTTVYNQVSMSPKTFLANKFCPIHIDLVIIKFYKPSKLSPSINQISIAFQIQEHLSIFWKITLLFQKVVHIYGFMVTSMGGHFHIIARNGTIDLCLYNGKIKMLKDICYVPSLYQNILSIGQIIDLYNLCIFSLTKYNAISIHTLHHIMPKGSQDKNNGLYKLDYFTNKMESSFSH